MNSILVQNLRTAATAIIRADGDRDEDFRSELLVEQALAVADALKIAADTIENLEGEIARAALEKKANG